MLYPGVPASWTAGLDQMHNLQSQVKKRVQDGSF